MQERISRPQAAGSSNRVVAFFIGLAERYLPDAFLFAVVLTLITFVLAAIFVTPNVVALIGAWYAGLWSILTFALQMALILLTGYVVAQSPGLPTRALGRIKQTLHASFESNLETALEREAEGQEICGYTQDHREGVAAFFEKREPNFIGR